MTLEGVLNPEEREVGNVLTQLPLEILAHAATPGQPLAAPPVLTLI